jgi:hypothetical protein
LIDRSSLMQWLPVIVPPGGSPGSVRKTMYLILICRALE